MPAAYRGGLNLRGSKMNKNRPLKSDQRYSVTLEHCGKDEPLYTVRFCDGKALARFSHYSSAVIFAGGESARRRGNLVIEAVES